MSYYSNVSFPKTIAEIPNEESFAILYPESHTVPGDERSRTNPGHGYPEHTVEYWRIELYKNEEDWVEEIKKLSNRRGYSTVDFKAVIIKPAIISNEIVVKK